MVVSVSECKNAVELDILVHSITWHLIKVRNSCVVLGTKNKIKNLHFITALHVSCWHPPDIIPLILTLPQRSLQGHWWSATHYFSNMFGAKTGFGAGLPRAHNTVDDSQCSTDIVQLQQLIVWKENITILFFPMTEGENFLQVRSCLQQTRGFYALKKTEGGNFWDLNTKLSWQALKEE